MVEVLVCDLGQVILGFDFSGRAESLRRACTRHPQPIEMLLGLHDEMGLTTGGDRGEEFYRRACSELGIGLSYEDFCAIWSDRFWEQRDVIDLVRRTHAARRALLSNTDCIHWDWIRSRFPSALDGFDLLLASHELGEAKPNAACYRAVEGLTGYPPEAHLLVDDVAANVEGARSAGWDGIVFTDAKSLESALAKRGLL